MSRWILEIHFLLSSTPSWFRWFLFWKGRRNRWEQSEIFWFFFFTPAHPFWQTLLSCQEYLLLPFELLDFPWGHCSSSFLLVEFVLLLLHLLDLLLLEFPLPFYLLQPMNFAKQILFLLSDLNDETSGLLQSQLFFFVDFCWELGFAFDLVEVGSNILALGVSFSIEGMLLSGIVIPRGVAGIFW